MSLQRNFKVGFGLIVVLYAILCFFCITLLENVYPNFNQKLTQHLQIETSLKKVHLSLSGWEGPETQRASFTTEVAQLRILMPGHADKERLDELERLFPQAVEGEAMARAQLLQILSAISQEQRDSFRQLSERIRVAAWNSSWSITIFGLVSIGFILAILFRFKGRALEPLIEISHVLQDWHQGNKMRRINVRPLDLELRAPMQVLNEMLDQQTYHKLR
ncbi:MAG: hypothetical protein ACOVS5_04360 [Oligoflexus sp.]|jgi:hypothetical protein